MRKIKHCKQGTIQDVLHWIIRIIVFAIVLFSLKLIMTSAVEGQLSTEMIEYDVLAKRLLFSQAGFAYVRSDRVYPGIIARDKFTNKTLQGFQVSRRNFAVKATLYPLKNNQLGKEVVVYDNPKRFDENFNLRWSKKFALKTYKEYVLIKEGDELKPGVIKIEIAYSTKLV